MKVELVFAEGQKPTHRLWDCMLVGAFRVTDPFLTSPWVGPIQPSNSLREAGFFSSLEKDLDLSFDVTFEQNCKDYWTVVIPPVEWPHGTKWHDEKDTLTCGVFYAEQAAHEWAQKRLEGHSYSVRFYEFNPEDYE